VLEFENLSERNAKHLYIEYCQVMPGYDCIFFSICVPSAGRFQKGPGLQLLGISSKSIVFLDEKTKVSVCMFVSIEHGILPRTPRTLPRLRVKAHLRGRTHLQ